MKAMSRLGQKPKPLIFKSLGEAKFKQLVDAKLPASGSND